MKNMYSISTDQMDSLSGTYNRTKIDASDAREFISSGFQGLSNSGLFARGIEAFNKQLDGLYSNLDASNRVITQFSDSSVELELNLKRKADDLLVPTDFIKSDNAKYVTIGDISLSKNDGKSINEGEKNLSNFELNKSGLDNINGVEIKNIVKNNNLNAEVKDNYSVNKNENLMNILGDNNDEFYFNDVSSIKEKTDIHSIVGSSVNIEQKDDDSDIEKENNFKSIIGNDTVINYEDRVPNINKIANLKSINNNEASDSYYGDNSTIKEKVDIANINGNGSDFNTSSFNFDNSQVNMPSTSSINSYSSNFSGNYGGISEGYSASTNINNVNSNELEEEKKKNESLSSIFNEIAQNYSSLINNQVTNDSDEEK